MTKPIMKRMDLMQLPGGNSPGGQCADAEGHVQLLNKCMGECDLEFGKCADSCPSAADMTQELIDLHSFRTNVIDKIGDSLKAGCSLFTASGPCNARAGCSWSGGVCQAQRNAIPFSLTTLFALHHNLVSFGTNGAYLAGKRTFYSPQQVCTLLKQSSLFRDDKAVHRFACAAPVADMPGWPMKARITA